ncbi:PHD finger protein 10 [Toxocara canis]|uniref:PHD finger protein 10 n=1 Tax=Toxocara canis TaxID=6265 RepID=A0A0B2V5E5_TOXCA|nr:PHD finger protein 10 [Toxocara canis]
MLFHVVYSCKTFFEIVYIGCDISMPTTDFIRKMEVFLGGDESSDSKVSDSVAPTDEFSNESTKLSSNPNEETNSEVVKKASISKSEGKPMVKSASSRVITADTTHMHIEPSHIIEYEWPIKSGERFFIQEQIAELLDVKSFKRKYPDLSRHTVEMNEREHLLANYKLASVINEHQMHGLTALRAIEVHELMAADYPAIYSEYQRAAADKVKLQMAEQQKQLDAVSDNHLRDFSALLPLDAEMHGLTALRAIEVHELMAADYPAIYSEYQRAAADKVKLQMAEQQKQLDAIKFDTKKLEELRKNAVRSAAEFNAEMNAIKKVERRHFWDIQTSIIQSPKNRWRRCIPEVTRPGPYPVALISGQFHEHYKRYSSAELRRLPLSTVLDYEYLLPPKRGTSPPPVVVHDEELLSPLPNEGDQDALPSLQSTEDGQSGAEEDTKKQVSITLA